MRICLVFKAALISGMDNNYGYLMPEKYCMFSKVEGIGCRRQII